MKKLIFLSIALAILLFSIIVINIAPVINSLIKDSKNWYKQACNSFSDELNELEKQDLTNFLDEQEKNEKLAQKKKELNRCKRKKAMVGLEYVISNLNIIFGFICAFLGYLHFINVGKLGKYIGLIGLGIGGIGFILNFVYVIESGLVFNDIDGTYNMRINSEGAYLEWSGTKYTCIFYDKDNKDSVYIKYSDYGKKYLNYNKDLMYPEGKKKFMFQFSDGCIDNSINDWDSCKDLDEGSIQNNYLKREIKYYDTSIRPNIEKGVCDKLYYLANAKPDNNEKKIIYDCWLTSIILICFIFLFYIGLGIFGFLLFNDLNNNLNTKNIEYSVGSAVVIKKNVNL